MRKNTLVIGLSALAVATALAFAGPASAHGSDEPGQYGGMMDPDAMNDYGMPGPGMMGEYGPGMMGGYGPGMMHGYGPGMMRGHGRSMMRGYGPGMMYGYGPGMMHGYGPGMMHGYGPGMMYGYGPGMMRGYGPGTIGRGWGCSPQRRDLNLSTDDVKTSLDRYVALMDNPHIKAGPVTEKDSSTITAEIVTTDKDALVERFEVDRRTGIWRSVD